MPTTNQPGYLHSLKLSGEQRRDVRDALPTHAVRAASECRRLGMTTRVRVRKKNADGTIYVDNVFANMSGLISHYRSYDKKDLLSWSSAMYFCSYKRWRRLKEPKYGETPAETQERVAANSDLKTWKEKASISKPDAANAKGLFSKWALKLDFPDLRQYEANEVHREAPLSQMRRVIYDLEQASAAMRGDKTNRALGWLTGLVNVHPGETDLALRFADLIAQDFSGYVVTPRAGEWLRKAERHCELYHEMLEEWVEENGRELNFRAVMWNLYYNPKQRPVEEYIWLVHHGHLTEAVMLYNTAHVAYLKEKTAGAWAKVRFWVFCHFPNRMSKIVNHWMELGAQYACKPPNFQGDGKPAGHLFVKTFMEERGLEKEEDITEEDRNLLRAGAERVYSAYHVQEEGESEVFPIPDEAQKIEEEEERKRKRREEPESGLSSDDEDGPSQRAAKKRALTEAQAHTEAVSFEDSDAGDDD